MEELMLTKAQFNIYEVEHYGVEENSLDELRRAGCTKILVLLRDHDRAASSGLRATSPKASPTRTNSNWSAPVYEGTNTTANFPTGRK